MANSISVKTRVQNKYDTKSNFDKASFVPLKGEIVFYDIDGILSHRKMKVGDGVTPIGQLPFENEVTTTYDSATDTVTFS